MNSHLLLRQLYYRCSHSVFYLSVHFSKWRGFFQPRDYIFSIRRNVVIATFFFFQLKEDYFFCLIWYDHIYSEWRNVVVLKRVPKSKNAIWICVINKVVLVGGVNWFLYWLLLVCIELLNNSVEIMISLHRPHIGRNIYPVG